MSYIIGLTGGIGSGKTTIANLFAEYNIDIVDADIVARDVVAVGSYALNKISDHFGENILLANGELDRSQLRAKIFADEKEKAWLNNLLHPLIREALFTQLNACKSAYCLLVAPLLIENDLTRYVQRVLVVDVSENTQLMRTCQRDNNDQAQVQAIINSQINRQERLKQADDIINNEPTDAQPIRQQVAQLHQKYLTLAHHR